MSMVKTLKEFVMKKEKEEEIHTLFGRPIGTRISITEVFVHTPEITRLRLILREDDEINRIHKHHDEWAEIFKQKYVGDDLQTRLAENEDFRQRRLQAAPAVVKRRAVKIQSQAEREADPVKMAQYLDKCENARNARVRSQAKYTLKEQTEMNRKRSAFKVTTPP
jgi:uncharacterized protein YhaN